MNLMSRSSKSIRFRDNTSK